MQSIQMQGWAQQIRECQESGMSVSKWCDLKGLNQKTYYYRRRRVREEFLETAGAGNSLVLSNCKPVELGTPVFAEIPTSKVISYATAATVQIGTYIAEINNGADLETVEGVLRTLSKL
jgi:hypothetical protein